MAEIIQATGVTEFKASITKGVGSLILYSTKSLNAFSSELISLMVERSGGGNIEITQGFVSLKKFILAATYGTDAVTCDSTFETIAVLELALRGAVDLKENDRLMIGLKGLDPNKTYIIDGFEEPNGSDDVYMYEEKTVPSDQKNYDVATSNYDILVIEDLAAVTELNFTHENGVVTKHTLRELRAMSQDNDPVAYIQKNGKVIASYGDFLQIPLLSIKSINIRKTDDTQINFFMRKDVQLVQLGLLK